MSDATGAPLQFDKAEPVAGGVPCGVCKAQLAGQYWTLNQLRLCQPCSERVAASLVRQPAAWPRAIGFGLGAAVAGSVLWFGIEHFMHLRLGLAAIAIGWMVGKAVRSATGPGSSPEFQVLAVGLTYVAIAGSNLLTLAAVSDDLSVLLRPEVFVKLATLPVTSASPMSIIIIGIALYEAWRFSKGVTARVVGPFALAAPAAAPVAHG